MIAAGDAYAAADAGFLDAEFIVGRGKVVFVLLCQFACAGGASFGAATVGLETDDGAVDGSTATGVIPVLRPVFFDAST